MTRLRPDVYRRAAEMLDERNGGLSVDFIRQRCGCCRAIDCAAPEDFWPELQAFVEWFKCRADADGGDYFWAKPWCKAGARDKQARVLALLFMEQIAKDENE